MSHPTPNTDRLHDDVEALLQPQTRRIDLDGGAHYTVTAPCLLEQIHDAVGIGSETGGRGVPGSRLPLNADVLDLWVEIATNTAGWAAVLGVDRRAYRDAPAAAPADRERAPAWMKTLAPWLAAVAWDEPVQQPGRIAMVTPTPNPVVDVPHPEHPPAARRPRQEPPAVGRLLRAVAAAAAGRPDRAALADRVAHNARRWVARIEATLTPPEHAARGLRGVPCRHCDATWVTDPHDAEQIRQSAVWVEYGETGIIRCLWCRACGGYTWRDDLEQQAVTRAPWRSAA